MIPLGHDFAGERVLVLGGGDVGARKARRFAREADVVVVSPTFADPSAFQGAAPGDAEREGSGGASRAGSVELVRAAPAPEDVAEWVDRVEPALVVAATDDAAVNAAAASAARERGLLVNRADRSSAGGSAGDAGTADAAADRTQLDVAVPATVREDPVVVGISTGGASPALARALRERVEAELEGAGAMAELTADLRERLRDRDVDPDERRAAVRAVVRSSDVWTALRTGDPNVEQITGDVVADVLEDR